MHCWKTGRSETPVSLLWHWMYWSKRYQCNLTNGIYANRNILNNPFSHLLSPLLSVGTSILNHIKWSYGNLESMIRRMLGVNMIRRVSEHDKESEWAWQGKWVKMGFPLPISAICKCIFSSISITRMPDDFAILIKHIRLCITPRSSRKRLHYANVIFETQKKKSTRISLMFTNFILYSWFLFQ